MIMDWDMETIAKVKAKAVEPHRDNSRRFYFFQEGACLTKWPPKAGQAKLYPVA